jgi:hypothetical protein
MFLKLIMPRRSGPVLDSFRLFRVIQTVSHIFDCYSFLLECNHVKSDIQTQISFFRELIFDDFEACYALYKWPCPTLFSGTY